MIDVGELEDSGSGAPVRCAKEGGLYQHRQAGSLLPAGCEGVSLFDCLSVL